MAFASFSDHCKQQVTCHNGGYQDPRHCERCKCPDGMGGAFCEQVAPSNDERCGGELELDLSGNHVTISTPGYDGQTQYDNNLRCNWRVKVSVTSF